MEDKNVQKLLDMLYGMIDEARGATFSSEKCIINREEALDLLDEVRTKLPAELSKAQDLMKSKEQYVEKANREVKRMLDQAQDEAKRLREQAQEESRRMLEKAQEESANREAALVNRVESAKRRAKESINYAHGQQREMAAALKAAQAALEQATQERDSAMARERAAQERADQEAAARQRLEKKLAGSRRIHPPGRAEAK